MGNPTICTIIAKNYLAHARVLAQSFLEQHPRGKVIALLVDRLDGYFDPSQEDFEVIELEELREQIPDFHGFTFQYNLLELATAVKPYFLDHLFQTRGMAKLGYFDPDILFLSRTDQIWDLLNSQDILLTPHLTRPLREDGAIPSEQSMLLGGAYNLGFIGLANRENTRQMLRWWKERLHRHCIDEKDRGYFVDQRWMDLVPGMFGSTFILRDHRFNVAYWNLQERPITRSGDRYLCCDDPIVFYHFSGYDPAKPDAISKHQSRFEMSDIGAARELFSDYSSRLQENGHEKSRKWPNAYSVFSNGVNIPDFMRRYYLKIAERDRYRNPFEVDDLGSDYFHWMLRPGPDGVIPMVLAMREVRPDVQAAFPLGEKAGVDALIHWATASGADEFGLDPPFRQALNQVSRVGQENVIHV